MSLVRLTGQLNCADADELRIVLAHLPRHIDLTRAEPGCLAFAVVQTENPLVWHVDEVFTDAAAFTAHQARVAASDWGVATRGIARAYEIDGR